MEKDDIICPGQTIKEQSTLTVSPLYNFSVYHCHSFPHLRERAGILSKAPKWVLVSVRYSYEYIFYFYFSSLRKTIRETAPRLFRATQWSYSCCWHRGAECWDTATAFMLLGSRVGTLPNKNSCFDFSLILMYYMRFLKDIISFSFLLIYSANVSASERKRTFNSQESVRSKLMSVIIFFYIKKAQAPHSCLYNLFL